MYILYYSMGPKTQKIQKSKKPQNSRVLQDTRNISDIEADEIINDYDNFVDEDVEQYNEEEPEIKPTKPIKSNNNMHSKEYQELLNYRLEQARIKKTQDAEKKRQREQQYLDAIKQQQEKELQKKLKRLANKQKKEIEKEIMNKYLNQIQTEEVNAYIDDEIEVKPTRVVRQPNNNQGYGIPPASAPPAFIRSRFV